MLWKKITKMFFKKLKINFIKIHSNSNKRTKYAKKKKESKLT